MGGHRIGAEGVEHDDVERRGRGRFDLLAAIADRNASVPLAVLQEREQRRVARDALDQGIDLEERPAAARLRVTRQRAGAEPDDGDIREVLPGPAERSPAGPAAS